MIKILAIYYNSYFFIKINLLNSKNLYKFKFIMEIEPKVEIDEIFEKEINLFDSSWNTLNNNCTSLKKYSTFMQKYLDIMNHYYMTLTELNSQFPNSSQNSENEFEIDSSFNDIANLLSSSIQIQLNNLLIFLSQTQTLVHSLNQVLSQSTNLIETSKKVNSDIFSNIKILNNNYKNEYSSMINSFENLENKIVENYIKKNYNKNENIDVDEEEIKNCVSASKKLENSFLNFNKEQIKEYFNQYNNNLIEIKTNKIILIKTFNNIIFDILHYLKDYYNNLKNEMEKEINACGNENSEDEDFNDFKMSDKDMNNFIYELFNSNKYNIKIITNKVINLNNKGKASKVEKSKFLLSEEDIYNIVKEIYNYDFSSINKEEYELEAEKEKLRINDLANKLLSYDLKLEQMESITDDEINILYDMLENNNEYILYFLSVLNEFRTQGKFEMPKRVFETINKIIIQSLDSKDENKKSEVDDIIVTLSFSFFMTDGKVRSYFGDIIKNNKIFKTDEFWNEYIIKQINKDLDKNTENVYDILLSKIIPSSVTMSKFGLEKNEIFDIIEPLMDQYGLNEKSKESLLSLVKDQL